MTESALLQDKNNLLLDGDGIDLICDDDSKFENLATIEQKAKKLELYDDRRTNSRIFVKTQGLTNDYDNLNKFEVKVKEPESPNTQQISKYGIHSIISHHFMKQINEESSEATSVKSSQNEESL